MAKLTSKARAALPASKFALPGGRYPIEDRAHAANAKARAKQQAIAGNLPPSAYGKVVAAANKVLKRGGARGR